MQITLEKEEVNFILNILGNLTINAAATNVAEATAAMNTVQSILGKLKGEENGPTS